MQERKIDLFIRQSRQNSRAGKILQKKGIASKAVTADTVKEAVRSVNDEEKRLGCFLIHGVEENDNEIPCNIVENVYTRKTKTYQGRIGTSYRRSGVAQKG